MEWFGDSESISIYTEPQLTLICLRVLRLEPETSGGVKEREQIMLILWRMFFWHMIVSM